MKLRFDIFMVSTKVFLLFYWSEIRLVAEKNFEKKIKTSY